MDVLSIIQEHSLCVRCIPKTVVSVWRVLPKNLEQQMKINNGVSATKSANFDEKSNMWIVREEKTPSNAGMWYIHPAKHNHSTVMFGKTSFIAPTIEEAIQLYLNSL